MASMSGKEQETMIPLSEFLSKMRQLDKIVPRVFDFQVI
jgi:hypothetical protein